MWIIGAGGQAVTINSFFATAILRFSPIDCVIAPEASGEVLESLGELLHTGRFSIVSRNKGIGDAGSTADLRMLWSAIVCLGLGLL